MNVNNLHFPQLGEVAGVLLSVTKERDAQGAPEKLGCGKTNDEQVSECRRSGKAPLCKGSCQRS